MIRQRQLVRSSSSTTAGILLKDELPEHLWRHFLQQVHVFHCGRLKTGLAEQYGVDAVFEGVLAQQPARKESKVARTLC